jgi:hypothetical protein
VCHVTRRNSMQHSPNTALSEEQMAQLMAIIHGTSKGAAPSPSAPPPSSTVQRKAAAVNSDETMEVDKKDADAVAAPDVAMRDARIAAVNKLPGFADIRPGYKPVQEQMVGILTPAADETSDAHAGMFEIECAFEEARGDMAAMLAVKTKVITWFKSYCYRNEKGEAVTDGSGTFKRDLFLAVFPDGEDCFELIKDKDDHNEQIRISFNPAQTRAAAARGRPREKEEPTDDEGIRPSRRRRALQTVEEVEEDETAR